MNNDDGRYLPAPFAALIALVCFAAGFITCAMWSAK